MAFSKVNFSFFLVILLCVVLSAVNAAVRVTRITAPSFVPNHHSFNLTCHYDAGDSKPFDITWSFKNDTADTETPFFRARFGHSYGAVNGSDMNVDVDASSTDTVVISPARLRDTGTYICSVRDEGMIKASKSVKVIVGVLPTEPPKIIEVTGDVVEAAPSHTVGDTVSFSCVSPPSYPMTALSWNVNGINVKNNTSQEKSRTEKGLIITNLSLSLKLQEKHFKNGIARLQCSSDIQGLSNSQVTHTIKDSSYSGTSSADHNTNLPKGHSIMLILKLGLQLLALLIVDVLW